MLKLAVGLVALATVFMSAVNLAFSLIWNPQGSVGWIAIRALASLVVIVVGSATLRALFSHARGSWLRGGAVLLLALGVATTAKSSYHALTGPDPEYWLVLLGLLLIAQAAGTLLVLGRAPHPA